MGAYEVPIHAPSLTPDGNRPLGRQPICQSVEPDPQGRLPPGIRSDHQLERLWRVALCVQTRTSVITVADTVRARHRPDSGCPAGVGDVDGRSTARGVARDDQVVCEAVQGLAEHPEGKGRYPVRKCGRCFRLIPRRGDQVKVYMSYRTQPTDLEIPADAVGKPRRAQWVNLSPVP